MTEPGGTAIWRPADGARVALDLQIASFFQLVGACAALGVHGAEVVLGVGIALLRRESEPLHRLGIVLQHALAAVVHDAEIMLGVGVTLRGG